MGNVSMTWLAIRASGITAWGLLTAVVLWGILLRSRVLTKLASPMRLLDMHRWLGATAVVFLLIHMLFLFLDSYIHFTITQLLIPGTAPWKAFAAGLGTLAFWSMIPVTIIGRLRPRLGVIGNRWFSKTHLIAYAAWPLATAHFILAGTDALQSWSIMLIIAGTALVVAALIVRGFVPAPAPSRTVRTLPANSARSGR